MLRPNQRVVSQTNKPASHLQNHPFRPKHTSRQWLMVGAKVSAFQPAWARATIPESLQTVLGEAASADMSSFQPAGSVPKWVAVGFTAWVSVSVDYVRVCIPTMINHEGRLWRSLNQFYSI